MQGWQLLTRDCTELETTGMHVQFGSSCLCVQAYRYKLGVQRFDFDSGLAPYPQHHRPQWQQLSGFISEAALSRLAPVSGFVDPLAEAEDLSLMKPSSAAERRLLAQLSDGRSSTGARAEPAHSSPPAATDTLRPERGAFHGGSARSESKAGAAHTARCCYTRIPHRASSGKQGTASAITEANLDKSTILQATFLDEDGGGALLLAELQLAFVTFMVGKSLEGAQAYDMSCTSVSLKP